jgi:hypothetical protein
VFGGFDVVDEDVGDRLALFEADELGVYFLAEEGEEFADGGFVVGVGLQHDFDCFGVLQAGGVNLRDL